MSRKHLTVFTLALLFLCSSSFYYFFVYDPLPPNMELIVSGSEYPDQWQLSPNGDKIAYSYSLSTGKTMILFLDAQRRQNLESCDIFWWVNNSVLSCRASPESNRLLVNTDDFSSFPVQVIEANNPKLSTILQQGGKIYRYSQGDDKINFFFILSADKNKPNENYQVNSTDITTTLKGYTYTQISFLPIETQKPLQVYSPNQAYYFIWKRGQITIYQAETHQQLAQYDAEAYQMELTVGGWAWDSSGVYLKGRPQFSILRLTGPSVFPILKLVIPK